jgi:hypothetical protein
LQRGDVQLAVRRMGQRARGGARLADTPRHAPRVDASDADQALRFQPGVEALRGAPVRRAGDLGAQHAAARGRGDGLDVFGIGADIADMGEGEIDDLAGIGRVGHDLLVAGNRGVEADFANRLARGAKALAPENCPVSQNQCRRDARGDGGIGWLRFGHAVCVPLRGWRLAGAAAAKLRRLLSKSRPRVKPPARFSFLFNFKNLQLACRIALPRAMG